MTKIFITLLLIVGCKPYSEQPTVQRRLPDTTISGQHGMTCSNVRNDFSGAMYRCENEEAICYVAGKGGISCKFK